MSKKAAKTSTPASKPAWFPRIGQIWPGQGIYAGIVRGEAGQPDHHLFLSEDPATQHAGIAWGAQGTDEPDARSPLDGLANTQALVKSKHSYPAAEWAANLNTDGHADWYLPSRRELRLLWVNCPELFPSGWYWSSTQYSAHYAWGQLFDAGNQDLNGKSYEGRARAVRRFVIQ